MCYSAQVQQAYDEYLNRFGADIDIEAFARLYGARLHNDKIKTPKALDAQFNAPKRAGEAQIKASIDAYRLQQMGQWEQELFKQRKRLADAQRILEAKNTKAATESARIATAKIESFRSRLQDSHRVELKDADSRIYPGTYTPVMVMEGGKRVVKPMRYQCRPAGKPASYDTQYPGTYNARLDNLEGFWRAQFGHTHGIMIVHAFYEHVSRPKRLPDGTYSADERENVILEFKPRVRQDMLVACLWSRWTGPADEELYSFAAITDEPPEEVAAAGHDRCIIPIKPENVETWLNPDPRNLTALYALLKDRERPYYAHRMAA
jgi:putative SOS response-associated peptidase YedK